VQRRRRHAARSGGERRRTNACDGSARGAKRSARRAKRRRDDPRHHSGGSFGGGEQAAPGLRFSCDQLALVRARGQRDDRRSAGAEFARLQRGRGRRAHLHGQRERDPGQNQSFTVKTFASSDGTGTPLSLQTIVATIVAGTTNPLNFTLNGVVSSLSAAFAVPSLPYEAPGSTTLTVNALDAAGDTIVGPGTYADASGNALTIAVTNGDTTGTTSLAQSTIVQPGAPIGFTYNGGALANDTVTASASGVASAAATIAFACEPAPSQEAFFVPATSANAGYGLLPLTVSGTSIPAPSSIVDPPGISGSAGIVNGAPIVDSGGSAYVSVPSLGSMTEFCPQASGTAAVPYRSIITSPELIFSSALDSARNLYAVEFAGASGVELLEYAPDSGTPGFAPNGAPTTAPTRTISDSSGANAIDYIYELGSGLYTGTVDSLTYAVAEFASNAEPNATPTSTFLDPANLAIAPTLAGIGLDPSGDVLVANAGSNEIYKYAAAAGNLYAASFPGASITEYASGTSTILRTISGPLTRLLDVASLAVDNAGNLYVGNQDGLTLEIFGPSQSGNVAPQQIVGNPVANVTNWMGFAIGPGNAAGASPMARSGPSLQSARALESTNAARTRELHLICATMPPRCPSNMRASLRTPRPMRMSQ
jgi:hypothetical protein